MEYDVRDLIPCFKCGGKGHVVKNLKARRCPYCKGAGKIYSSYSALCRAILGDPQDRGKDQCKS